MCIWRGGIRENSNSMNCNENFYLNSAFWSSNSIRPKKTLDFAFLFWLYSARKINNDSDYGFIPNLFFLVVFNPTVSFMDI